MQTKNFGILYAIFFCLILILSILFGYEEIALFQVYIFIFILICWGVSKNNEFKQFCLSFVMSMAMAAAIFGVLSIFITFFVNLFSGFRENIPLREDRFDSLLFKGLVSGLIICLIGIGPVIMIIFFVVNPLKKYFIRKNGVRVLATITSSEQTGVYVNEQPEIALTVKFEYNGQQYKTVAKQVFSYLDTNHLNQGQQIYLIVNRKNPKKAIVE